MGNKSLHSTDSFLIGFSRLRLFLKSVYYNLVYSLLQSYLNVHHEQQDTFGSLI